MSAPQFERRRHVHYVGFSQNCDPVSDLWTPPSVPVDTSEAAAQAIQEVAPSIRERIVRYIAAQGERGATAGEVCDALALNPSTARPRLREAEGSAPWCRGQLPARIEKTSAKRNGMRVYSAR